MSLMIMKGSITLTIRGAIPDSDNAMNYIKFVEEQFLGTSKSLASTLMIKMITMKYDGHSGVREHIMKMSAMASQLKGMDMAISEVDIPPNSWWIDTCASIHITNSLQGYLTSKRLSKEERTITLGNGTEVEIEAIGTLRLILDTGFIMDLVDTVYVPIFTRNLISVLRLDSYGYELKFGNNGVSLFYNSCLVGSGTLHVVFECIKGKYTKVKKKGASRTIELLECIYSDIWGPYSIPTINGHKYFISFIDDFSSINTNDGYGVTQEVSRNENENVPTTEVLSLCRSQREKRPAISNDYEVYLNECDYDVGLESDPTSYGQAINSKNSTLWLYAMEEELKSMKDNEVWDLVELPKGIKTIGCKWILKPNMILRAMSKDTRPGIEIHQDRSRGLLGLSQKNYIEKVLKRFNMQNCSSSVAPVVKGDIFCELQCPKNDLEKKQMDKIPYASAVGSIMYAQVCTRPDIAYVVGMLGRYQSNPVLIIGKQLRKYCVICKGLRTTCLHTEEQ
ncbi:Retrovirus-related Pol polyprotein from transposon TNT 1-94 [Vitis vinifera]|uniref:Retrovirus-related Pol polyprotein from transposon TNT 1-94 n=1 Tax=Vitis vinifera TaxID=29760 RepID=A0A438IQL0_VITVI|nr:Retrovirus-related Pol polyprotein from transposon TNT 1-94 [Vitis vinifera]